jgi:hypothetical protein
MPRLHRSLAALRVTGDDLDPAEITTTLGCAPSKAQRKGETFTGATGKTRTAKFGMWLIEAEDREPEDLNGQVKVLLARLTSSVDAWRSINARYTIDLYCGLFMRQTNEGLTLSVATLQALSDRGIEVSLELYSPSDEDLEHRGVA